MPNRPAISPGDLQELIRVNSDSLENFSRGKAKIFGGFDDENAGRLEVSQDGESEIRQRGKDRTQVGAAQVVAILDEVQRVLDLPVREQCDPQPDRAQVFEGCTALHPTGRCS